ncbi:MAG: ABC transporter substrate-binding protein [Oleiphilus sp.]
MSLFKLIAARCAVVLLCFTSLQVFAKSEINFALLVLNGQQRNAYFDLVQKFERHYPSIKVNIQAIEQEHYKQQIELWLKSASRSDVMFWFGGERLNQFVSQDLIEPIDELWQRYNWQDRITESAQSAAQVKGVNYGLPIHYYNWGIYYNKRLFDKFGLVEPQTWQQFLEICEKLQTHGVTPLALGSKDDWPVAGWFDYLNLRMNGLAFHQSLMNGDVSYLDDRVRSVFEQLAVLVNEDYFLKAHEDKNWKAAFPYLYRNMAAMVLMGNFWTSQIPEALKQDFSLFRFPQVVENMPYYEEAPTDLLFIPRNAVNKKDAAIFLNFLSSEAVQFELNDALGMLAPQKKPRFEEDHFLGIGADILRASKGLSQYYDRDNPTPIALEGMKQMKRFLINPSQLDEVLFELERLRNLSFHHPVMN